MKNLIKIIIIVASFQSYAFTKRHFKYEQEKQLRDLNHNLELLLIDLKYEQEMREIDRYFDERIKEIEEETKKKLDALNNK